MNALSPAQEQYIETATVQAAITLQWQATDAADLGNGYPITEGGDEYTDQVAPLVSEAVGSFVRDMWDVLQSAGVSAEQAGHDFILTANRHGAGFWDRGLGDAGGKLTEAAHAYGDIDAEFALWGDEADDDEHCHDEVAYLMVLNTVIVDHLHMADA